MWNFDWNKIIFCQDNALEISSAKWRPIYLIIDMFISKGMKNILEISNPRVVIVTLLLKFDQQGCCRVTCQISDRSDNCKEISRGFAKFYVAMSYRILERRHGPCKWILVKSGYGPKQNWSNQILSPADRTVSSPVLGSIGIQNMDRLFTIAVTLSTACPHIDGLVQYCSISIANALEILQSHTEPSIYPVCHSWRPHSPRSFFEWFKKCLWYTDIVQNISDQCCRCVAIYMSRQWYLGFVKKYSVLLKQSVLFFLLRFMHICSHALAGD